jgi:hypothetical protein
VVLEQEKASAATIRWPVSAAAVPLPPLSACLHKPVPGRRPAPRKAAGDDCIRHVDARLR